MKTFLSGIVGSLVLLLGVLQGHAFAGPDFPMVLVVTDSTGLATDAQPLYLASNLNNWDPADPAWKLTRVTAPDGTVTWEAPLKPEQLASRDVEYKLTRGSWETVEVGPDGQDISNRSVGSAGWGMDGARLAMKVQIAGFADQRATRWPEINELQGRERTPSVTGTLEIMQVRSAYMANARPVRVWLPPGYADEANKDRRYPVLYMNDGQNVFDRATSFGGSEWGADEAATTLIENGTIEPLIIVGIDNVGSVRALEYNPAGIDFQGKPGRAEKYMEFVTLELMPFINDRFRTKTGPENTSFGGSSYGGNLALFAAMNNPDVFGRVLIESPAVFISDKMLIRQAAQFDKQWPQRMFLAVGTAETSGAGRAAEYLASVKELSDTLRSKGLSEKRLKFVIAQDAVHNEQAWAARLPEAMEFLFGN